MVEGWLGDEYLILFSEAEIPVASERYAVSQYIERHKVVGLRGWDDLILKDSMGHTYCVPAVPLQIEYRTEYRLPVPPLALEPDDRYAGKIKWYVKPLVFGGAAEVDENIVWVDHSKHGELVTWWNRLYRDMNRQKPQL
jgi:hypothetical protein